MNNNTVQYLKKETLGKTKELDKNFLVALSIGIVGLMLDGITINIFDSSKVAMYLWAFIGVAAKLNVLYKNTKMCNQRVSKFSPCNVRTNLHIDPPQGVDTTCQD